jgi:hypothetical protein
VLKDYRMVCTTCSMIHSNQLLYYEPIGPDIVRWWVFGETRYVYAVCRLSEDRSCTRLGGFQHHFVSTCQLPS